MNCIVGILKEFSLEEIKSFERFLNSSYHNKSEKLKILFKEIKKFYPTFTNKKLTKQYLSKKISQNLKYNDSTFRNLISDLQILIEKFLVIEQLFKNGIDSNILLLKSLIDKRQDNLFKTNLKKILAQVEKNGIDSSYYYSKRLLESYKFNYNILNKNEKSKKYIDDNIKIINSYIIYLINYFVTEVINSHLKFVMWRSNFKIGEKANFSLSVLESIDINKISCLIKEVDKDNFFLNLYLNLFLSFYNIENKQYYQNYKSLVSKYHKRLSNDELSYHYSMFISYCVIKNSSSENKFPYDNELFRNYNIFLRGKFFIDKKSRYINETLYRNILILSLRLNKFTWTFKFVSYYSKYLHPGKSKNLINLSYAEYYYHLGSYNNSSIYLKKAFNYLKEIREESFVIKHDIKILYLMIYYDLGYFENLITLLKNYRKFLYRNFLIQSERRRKLNKFLNVLEKLVYLKEGDPKIDIAKLNIDIAKLKNFNYHGWLLNKVQTLNINSHLQN